MQIKIDIDNHKFNEYIKHFKKMYNLISCKIQFDNAQVFRTKHGYHIYIKQNRVISKKEINVIECLLGSDLFKQAYYYLEGNDILFKIKNGVAERYADNETKKLNKIINTINKKKCIMYRFKIY